MSARNWMIVVLSIASAADVALFGYGLALDTSSDPATVGVGLFAVIGACVLGILALHGWIDWLPSKDSAR